MNNSNQYELTVKQKEILRDMCFDMPKGKEAWLFSREGKQLQYHLFLTPELAKTSIEDLDVKSRAVNALKRAEIFNIGELVDIVHCTADLKSYRNLGIKTAQEIMLSLLFSSIPSFLLIGGRPI